MENIPIINGLYAITPDEDNTDELLTKVLGALDGGVRFLQYRAKTINEAHQSLQAEAIKRLCDCYNAQLIINDNIELCLHLDAFGVHLGEYDDTLATARKILGPDKMIGVSCYNSMERVKMATINGANYIALGAFFPTTSKPNAPHVTIEQYYLAKNLTHLPIVGIGGITLKNASELISHGVKTLAMINSLFMSDNIQGTAKQFIKLFEINEKP